MTITPDHIVTATRVKAYALDHELDTDLAWQGIARVLTVYDLAAMLAYAQVSPLTLPVALAYFIAELDLVGDAQRDAAAAKVAR